MDFRKLFFLSCLTHCTIDFLFYWSSLTTNFWSHWFFLIGVYSLYTALLVSSNCQQSIITQVVRNCQYQNGLWAYLSRIVLNALMGTDLAYTSATSFEFFFFLPWISWVVEAEQQTCMRLFLPNFTHKVMVWLTCFKVLPYFHMVTDHNLELSANINPFSIKLLPSRYFITATQMKLREEWWYLPRYCHESILCTLTMFIT